MHGLAVRMTYDPHFGPGSNFCAGRGTNYRNYGKEKRYSEAGSRSGGIAANKNNETGARTRRNRGETSGGESTGCQWRSSNPKTGREEEAGKKGGEEKAGDLYDGGDRAASLLHRGAPPAPWASRGFAFRLDPGGKAAQEGAPAEDCQKEAGGEKEGVRALRRVPVYGRRS